MGCPLSYTVLAHNELTAGIHALEQRRRHLPYASIFYQTCYLAFEKQAELRQDIRIIIKKC